MTIPLNELDFELRNLCLIRKHVPRDATSFYRCFADILFGSQRKHAQVRQTLIQFAESDPEWMEFSSLLCNEEMAAVPAMVMLTAVCFRTPVVLFHQPSPDLSHTICDPFAESGNDEAEQSPICLATYFINDCYQFDIVVSGEQIMLASLSQGK